MSEAVEAGFSGLVSTEGHGPSVDLRTAVFQGLAPDGGLYMPRRLEPLSPEELRRIGEAESFPETAARVLGHLLAPELDEATLRRILQDALDFPVPVVSVAPAKTAVELFHGPTLAFKDIGARFLASLMSYYLDGEVVESSARPVTVLVATSGDTGGAVAQAFHRVPGIRVVVLYPRGRVSPRQERQFTTLGDNIRALEVDGSFDDCQRMTKEAFADPELRICHRLTSANSINVGRLLPQVSYYFWAWSQIPRDDRPLVMAVPSGNFGNLAAGIVAKRLGLPVTRFVAATNANDVVPTYLAGGSFHPRPSVSTLSSAMDVGDPSNFRRIRHLYADDREAIVRDVLGSAHDDAETRACIARVHHEWNYVLDPHSAVGWLGLARGMQAHPEARGMLFATAHPAKFPDVVEGALGSELPVPEQLDGALRRKPRFTPIPASSEALARVLEKPNRQEDRSHE